MIKCYRKDYFVYILSNKSKMLYVGYTDNLIRRIKEHNGKKIEGFTQKYNITILVYYEKYDSPLKAENREKHLKRWHREWKINLIESENKDWNDLFGDVLTENVESISTLMS